MSRGCRISADGTLASLTQRPSACDAIFASPMALFPIPKRRFLPEEGCLT